MIRKKGFGFALALLLSSGHFALLPGESSQSPNATQAPVPGPDLIVGDLPALQEYGSFGTQVGLALATTACNQGDQEVNWARFPNIIHPFVPQNLYRMSSGPNNNDRFEQIGQAWLKHGLETFQENSCGFGCIASSSIFRLGVGCSDTYVADLNANQNFLGSRAWANPFTGAFPSNANDHTGHTHFGPSHRILVENNDLNTVTNAGATYYAEAQYITSDEYNWCQSHPGQCNMYNNASYRRFNVTGSASPFSFSPVGATVRMVPAINAWTGATINTIEPAPGTDGRAFIGYKVTNPSPGVWHYEYALYNYNLDRAIQSFGLPLGCGIAVSNLGFHAPLNHPGFANDGTVGNAGFSNAPWTASQTANALSWSSETFAQNQNANALRFATLYNFRFDSNHPPQSVNATIGFFKTGAPVAVAIKGPAPDICNGPIPSQIVSRKTHGAAGPFDINLPLTGNAGVECRSGGAGNDYQVVFNFPNPVTFSSAQLTTGQGMITSATGTGTTVVTVNLTGVTNAQTITLTLFDLSDNMRDGNLQVQMAILVGDTGGNKTVNSSDVSQTKSKSGQALNSSNFREDVTVDGSINATDVSLVKSKSGTAVPASL
jgi:hypothetical protein